MDLPRDIPLDSVEVLRSIITDLKVTPTKNGRMTKLYSSPCFIANYFNAEDLKMEVKRRSIKAKELRERCIIKAFKLSNQEWYAHVGPKVTSSQDGKKRLCLVDDLKVFKITLSHTSQDK
nr:hypothetical protein [Tanacetum cinerariifolium]